MSGVETGPPMTAWRNELIGVDDGLADQLAEASDPYGVLRDLRLPVPQYIGFASIEPFIEDPDSHLDALARQGISNFYVGLRSEVAGLPKFRTTEAIPREEVLPYVLGSVPPEQYGDYMLRVAEYIIAVAGITVIVNRPIISPQPDTESVGAIHLEIVKGDLGPLATGYATPDFCAATDRSGILRYYQGAHWGDGATPLANDESSFLDTPMRTAIWRGISAIPRVFGKQRLPGYYEFGVVDHGGQLVPLFVDAKPRTDSRSFYDV
jgi:hypothetical protein